MPSAQPPLDRSNPEPRLDLTRIDFPSDRITIKNLRQLSPQAFDPRSKEWADFEDDLELPGFLRLERDLANAAFDAVLGRRTVVMSGEEVEMLAALYVRYKLASGPHHAEQLIRSFEQAAAEQARQITPDLPPR